MANGQIKGDLGNFKHILDFCQLIIYQCSSNYIITVSDDQIDFSLSRQYFSLRAFVIEFKRFHQITCCFINKIFCCLMENLENLFSV